MSGMKSTVCALVFLGLAAAAAPRAAAQTASIEFMAQATPSGGLQEPVRGFPFFLLSKSFAEIGKEAAASYPKPDMNAFIDKLEVSTELKAWMKKNDWVTLRGEDFIQRLRPDDILTVPEFKKAYLERNSGNQSADFPEPKFKASDEKKNPEKFKKLSEAYTETIRHYIEAHPASTAEIDLSLVKVDPSPKWNAILGSHDSAVHQRTLDLAQSNYLVARAETDLQGQGYIRGLAPGNYWLSTLDVPAVVGDARPRWDVAVTVRAGEAKYVTLTNSNSVRAQPTP